MPISAKALRKKIRKDKKRLAAFPRLHDYAVRNELLRSMGYPSYEDYLASDLWAGIKGQVLASHGGVCRLCGDATTIVHHRSYSTKTLAGEDLRWLVPLCRYHHRVVEFDKDGLKRELWQADGVFRVLFKKAPAYAEEKNRQRLAKKTRGRCSKCGCRAKKGTSLCRPCSK